MLIGGTVAYYLFAPDKIRPMLLKSETEKFCLACEDVIKERLKSPSSYIRTECNGPYTEPATKQSYLEHDKNKSWEKVSNWRKRQIESGELMISTVFLRYEAANSYGALVAGLQACTVDHREGSTLSSATKILGPNIDGYSSTGWTIHRFIENQ